MLVTCAKETQLLSGRHQSKALKGSAGRSERPACRCCALLGGYRMLLMEPRCDALVALVLISAVSIVTRKS